MLGLLIAVTVAAAPCDQNEFPRAALERPVVLPMCGVELTQAAAIGIDAFENIRASGVTEVRASLAPELQLRGRLFESFAPFVPFSGVEFGVARSINYFLAVEVLGSFMGSSSSSSLSGMSFGMPVRVRLLPWLGVTGLESVVSLSWGSAFRNVTFVTLAVPLGVLFQLGPAWSLELKLRPVLYVAVPVLTVETQTTVRLATNNRLDFFATLIAGGSLTSVYAFTGLVGVSVRFFPG